MKYLTLLLSFLAITIINYAQDINYYSGATIQNDENASTKFFQQDENNLYAFTYLNPVYYLDVFDKDSLQRQSHIKIPLPAKDSLKYTIENLFILKDRFLVFYSYFSNTESAERLEMIAFDQNGNKTEAAKLIDQLPGKNDKKAGTFVVKNIPSKNNFLYYGYKKIKGAYALNIDHFDYNGNKL